jgi:hypothetical protein
MAKRNIILTESQVTKLFKNVIKETRRFENQEMVDAILDKINDSTAQQWLDNRLSDPVH